ncbi:MAG: alcohol dehydrogenase [Qingshengfaniella sp.]
MKAWVAEGHGTALQPADLPDRAPQGTEVVVSVAFCGLCHSDLHLWHGTVDLGPRGVIERPLPPSPIAFGHEISGTVARVGPEAKDIAPGDKVVVFPWIGCGKCPACLAGQENLCSGTPRFLGMQEHGGFADEVTVPHPRYLVPLGDLDPALAATYACSGVTVRSAIRKILPRPADDPVVIIGAGGLGLQAVAVLKALGHDAIVVTDANPAKAETVQATGAHFVVTGAKGDLDAVLAVTGDKVGAVLDFVNNAATATLGFDLLRKGGKMVPVGLHGGEMALPLFPVAAQALTIEGNLTGTLQDFKDVLRMAREGALAPTPIERVAKSEINDAMARLEAGDVAGRLVLER